MTTDRPAASCCAPAEGGAAARFDWLFYGAGTLVVLSILLHMSGLAGDGRLNIFSTAVAEMVRAMWWGAALGLFFVGLLGRVPRAYFPAIVGRGGSASGIFRAVLAGLLVDLCSHGIVLVAARLYERGVSLPQIMAFLVASPWNSLSLTLILIAVIGWKLTMMFVGGSLIIAAVTGFLYMALTQAGIFPANPHAADMPDDFRLKEDMRERLRGFRPSPAFFTETWRAGLRDGRVLIRWLFVGMLIAAAVKTFIPVHHFTMWFGPTLPGLLRTLAATSVMAVCSQGSAPIAALIVNLARAAGNAFTFLMAGVATDYTQIMVLRQATGSWKIALSLPLVTVPQILLLGYLMNMWPLK